MVKRLKKCSVLFGFRLACALEAMPFYQNLAASLKHSCTKYISSLSQSLDDLLEFVLEHNNSKENDLRVIVDLCRELGPHQPRYTFRLTLAEQNQINLFFNNLAWCLGVQFDKDDVPESQVDLVCDSLFDTPVDRTEKWKKDVALSVEFECKAFKLSDWTCHTIFKSQVVKMTCGVRSECSAGCVLDPAMARNYYQEFVNEKGLAHYEVTVRMLKSEGLLLDHWQVTEDMLDFPELSFSI